MPKPVQERLQGLGKNPAEPGVIRDLYEGIFRRAAEAYPLDYEYCIRAKPEHGQPVYFPATAPKLNQTVVIYPAASS